MVISTLDGRQAAPDSFLRFVAAVPQKHGGSPRIYSGEERFSVPEKAALNQGALALGVNIFDPPILQAFGLWFSTIDQILLVRYQGCG
jgi:hypothetical protein